MADRVLATNRKARYEYHVEETLECGVVLLGTEVKSVKASQFSFADAYAEIRRGEMMLVGLHVTPYEHANQFNHEPNRPRKLLAHREEIEKLRRRVVERGQTLIPLRFYLKRGLVKVEIGLCRGKHHYDKRKSIKERDQKRDLDRELRQYR